MPAAAHAQPVAMLTSRAASLRLSAMKTAQMTVGPSVRGLSTAVGASSGAEVVVVGSNIIDMTAYTPRLPARGETILGTEFQTGFGGKVGVGFHRDPCEGEVRQ